MEQPRRTGAPPSSAPSFYLAARQPLRPLALLLAVVAASGVLSVISYGLGRTGHRHFAPDNPRASRSPGSTSVAKPPADDDDDPSQVDTIVLGDAADAPVPARRGDRPGNVHATILVRLPRFGEQMGLIPDTPSGHLLYGWLAAFNQTSSPALAKVLPNVAAGPSAEAQIALRMQTGGFNLLSAKEVQPGVLVFRLRDQTPLGVEVLGTLHVQPNSSPPTIASFSLRSVP